MTYEELLDKAYNKVKLVETSNGERFEIPLIEGRVEGKTTIITNFSKICNYLRRKPEHLCKFLSKELATPSIIKGERLILNRKLPKSKIQDKLNLYVKEFVLCKECGKPDTEITKQDRMSFVHCLACGAKHSISSKI